VIVRKRCAPKESLYWRYWY